MCSALAHYYSIEEEEGVVNIIKNNFPILHMYGRLDPLPWESREGRIYGEACSSELLNNVSKNIKLVHDVKKDKTINEAIK